MPPKPALNKLYAADEVSKLLVFFWANVFITNTIIKKLSTFAEVTCCESVSGQSDLFLEIQTNTTDQLEDVIDKIGQLKGVEHTESSIVLKRFFNRGESWSTKSDLGSI